MLRQVCLHIYCCGTQARAGTAPRDSGGTGGFWDICSRIHRDDSRDTKCDSSVFVDACATAQPHNSSSLPACKQRVLAGRRGHPDLCGPRRRPLPLSLKLRLPLNMTIAQQTQASTIVLRRQEMRLPHKGGHNRDVSSHAHWDRCGLECCLRKPGQSSPGRGRRPGPGLGCTTRLRPPGRGWLWHL